MMKRKGLCTKRTIVGALVLSMGAVTTSTIAQEIGQVEDPNLRLDQLPIQTGFECPRSFLDEDGVWHVSQSANPWVDAGNSVACGIADLGQTTANGWARCFDLNAEGIVGDFAISTVYFGVQQASIDGINISVNLYIDSDGCPPTSPGGDAVLLASASIVIDMSDAGSGLKHVDFPKGTVAPAGSTLIIEIEQVDDGTVEPFFQFRPRSNDLGQCGSSYIRAADCGIPGWLALEDIGFPTNYLVLKCTGTEGEPPGNTGCDDCTAIGDGVFQGSNVGGDDDGDISSCGLDDTIAVWYCYTASCDGTVNINTCGTTSGLDTVVSVFDSCGGQEIACNDDGPCSPPGLFLSELDFPATAGTVYYIRVAGWNGATGSFELSVSCEPGDAAPPCPWDLDGDNVIATSDLLILFSQWGIAGTADFDKSGAVGTADLLILFSNWGPCP